MDRSSAASTRQRASIIALRRGVGAAGLLGAVLVTLAWPPGACWPDAKQLDARGCQHARHGLVGCGEAPQGGASACFAPGTPLEQVERVLAAIPGAPADAFSLYGRWSYTATNGATGSSGAPITLTYSFPPDTSTGDPLTSNVMHATFDTAFGSRAAWKALFADIFDDWSALTGIAYVEVADDGASWPGASGQLGVRGDIRIICTAIDGPTGTLAYNYYPDVGDMALDKDENWAAALNDYRFMRNIILHENGHGIGLQHVLPRDGTKLMEAYLSTGFAGPQDDDVRGANSYYGDRFESNESSSAARNLGAFTPGQTISNLSLHNPTDNDWFSVSTTSGAMMAFEAAPLGAAYTVSSDPGTPAAIDTRARLPLRVSVYAANGTTLLSGGNAAAGGTAVSTLIAAPGGTVFVKISADSASGDVQRYSLRMTQSGPSSRRLSVTSLPGGAAVQAAPVDVHGLTSVTTPGELAFNDGQTATLTAATNVGQASFVHWVIDGTVQAAGQRSANIVMNGDRAAQAVYAETLSVDAGADVTIVAGERARLQPVISGGTPTYSYNWSPATGLSSDRAATPYAAPAQTTIYTLTLTDAAGAQAIDSVTVHVAPALAANAGSDQFVAPGQPFTLLAAASGGEPPYTYAWSPATPLGGAAGTAQAAGVVSSTTVFTLTVRDAVNRVATDSMIVGTNGPLVAGLNADAAIQLGGAVSATPTVSGGDPPYSFEWSPVTGVIANGAFATLAPRQTTTYTLTVTDAFGQRSSATARITVVPLLQAAIDASQMTVEDGQSVTLSAVVSGGLPPLNYSWSPAETLSDTHTQSTIATPGEPTAYTLTVTDAAGQQATATTTIYVTRTAGITVAPSGVCGAGLLWVLPGLLLWGVRGSGNRLLLLAGPGSGKAGQGQELHQPGEGQPTVHRFGSALEEPLDHGQQRQAQGDNLRQASGDAPQGQLVVLLAPRGAVQRIADLGKQRLAAGQPCPSVVRGRRRLGSAFRDRRAWPPRPAG